MPIIKEYVQQYSAGAGGDFTGRRATEADFGATNSGLYEFGTGVIKAADMLQKHEEQREEADAQVKIAQARDVWAQREDELRSASTIDKPTAGQIREEMTNYFGELRGQYKTKGAQKLVTLYGLDMTRDKFQRAIDYDVGLTVETRINQAREISQSNANEIYKDWRNYEKVVAQEKDDFENSRGVYNIPGASSLQKEKMRDILDKNKIRYATSALEGTIESPRDREELLKLFKAEETQVASAATSAANKQAIKVDQPSIISTIIGREGGYVADDNKRGPTKYGINGKSNGLTEQQVKDLTPEKAAEIYKKNYWDKYGLDEVPPGLAPIVMDAVVNHRSAFAKQIVDAAKGGASVETISLMRKIEYDYLVTKNPDNKKYLSSWKKRVDESAAQSQNADAEGYGTRPDGTQKGSGWLGELKRPDGSVSTELSIQFDDVAGGKPFPLLVPTLTKGEVNTLLSLKEGEQPPKDIINKAVAHAEKRIAEGKSPFNEEVKQPATVNLEPKNAPQWWKDLPYEIKDKGLKEMRQRSKQDAAIYSHTLDNQIKDTVTWTQDKGTRPENYNSIVSQIADPGKRMQFSTTVEAMEKAYTLRNAPVEEQQAYIKSLTAGGITAIPGEYDFKSDLADKVAASFAKTNKARVDNPIGAAIDMKFTGGMSYIKDYSAEGFTAALKVRDPQATAISGQWGSPFRMLENTEAKAAKSYIDSLDHRSLGQWMTTVRRSLPQEKFMNVMQQIAPNDGALLGIASIRTSAWGQDKTDYVTDMMGRGRTLLNQSVKGDTNEQERGLKRALLPNPSDAGKEFAAYMGQYNGLGDLPQSAINRMAEAVTAYYVGDAKNRDSSANLDLTDKDVGEKNKQAFKAAIDAVVGRPSKIGMSNVLRPFGMPDDEFKDKVTTIVAEKTKDFKYGPNDKAGSLSPGDYSLLMVDGGRYQLSVFGQPRNIYITPQELASTPHSSVKNVSVLPDNYVISNQKEMYQRSQQIMQQAKESVR